MPLLNQNISVLALDIPGFGKSSNPPDGLSPSFLELIIWIRYLIKDYFKWKKVTLLGHSFGSNLSFSYSGMFPEEVDKFVSIDCSRINMASKSKYLIDDLRRGYIGGLVKTMKIPCEGNYQLFLDYMFESRAKTPFKLSKYFCEILLSRELEKIGDDLYRNLTDPKIHLKYTGRPTLLFLDALAENIKCQMLVIRATRGVLVNHRKEILEKQLSMISQNSPRLAYEVVEGGHHVHLENPERIAPLINNFLETGKWWGCRKTQPIVAIHGLFDNAGSFDTLLPLLDTKSVLCLDLPGNGLSSHFPKGMSIHFQQYLIVLRYIFTEYYKWDKVSLICHSFGSSVGFAYAGIYPEHVDRMVNLDCGRFWTAGYVKTIVEDFRTSTDGFNDDSETYQEDKGYSWDETISRLLEGRERFGLPISRKNCEIIARRGVLKLDENKYRFSHDKRLKFRSFGRCTKKMLSEFAERITCNVLNITASNGIIIPYIKYNKDEWHNTLKKLDKGSNLIDVTVDGTHHVHLENPEIVAPYLNDFFKK